jgi:hypothetical protein
VAGDNVTVVAAFTTQLVNGVTVVTLTFSGANTDFGSLQDGNWTPTVDDAKVSAANSGTLMASDFSQQNIKRLYGGYDGNGVVNAFDFAKFHLAYGSGSADPSYIAFFDYDANGAINAFDFAQFRMGYGSGI